MRDHHSPLSFLPAAPQPPSPRLQVGSLVTRDSEPPISSLLFSLLPSFVEGIGKQPP